MLRLMRGLVAIGVFQASAAVVTAQEATPKQAPAEEKVVFSRDVAPIFVANCTGCHNPKDKERRGKLDLSTFEAIQAGTPSEKVIVAGAPGESHLVLRIKGEESPRMPQGANRSLSEAAIAKIDQWVKEGAILDAGKDPKAPIASYAASPEDVRKGELARLSAEDRDRKVEEVGRERFKKGDPKASPDVTTTAHFLMLGAIPKDRATATLKALESQYNLARTLVGPAALDWGEKAGVYVFNDAASLGEFVRILENREVDVDEPGTARFEGPQPYVAVLDPLGGRPEPPGKRAARGKRPTPDQADVPTRSLAGVASEQFMTAIIAKAGKPPKWLTLGMAAYSAAKVEPGSLYYQGLRREALGLYRLGWTSKANDALGSATKDSEIRAVGFAAIECLSAQAGRSVVPLTREMLGGKEKLDEALENVLGLNRAKFLAVLGEFVSAQYGRAR